MPTRREKSSSGSSRPHSLPSVVSRMDAEPNFTARPEMARICERRCALGLSLLDYLCRDDAGGLSRLSWCDLKLTIAPYLVGCADECTFDSGQGSHRSAV